MELFLLQFYAQAFNSLLIHIDVQTFGLKSNSVELYSEFDRISRQPTKCDNWNWVVQFQFQPPILIPILLPNMT